MIPQIVVDTNRIIAALIRDSISRRILHHADVEFFAISFSSKELETHRSLIKEKADISDAELDFVLKDITERLIFIDDSVLDVYMSEANKIMGSIDPDDSVFIAAALAVGAGIWSEDKHFQRQKKVKIWKTEDLARLL